MQKKNLEELHPILVASKREITEKVHNFMNAKNELIKEGLEIGKIVETKFLPLYSPSNLTKLITWIDSVTRSC